ncbi:uncharacterized protein C22orf15 [Seriola aureovittata]|nr:uncharacterized protein C22orf15 [Seriola aureovittata]
MFVTILFGDSGMEMLNLNCRLINFLHHLKERCGLDFKECVDLMDSSGSVMNLQAKQHSEALASSVLVERQCYVLLQVCNDDTGGQKYVSLLNNHSQSHPEFTELLRKLSNPNKGRDRKMRGGWTQRNNPAKQTRRKKNISANNKSHRMK